MADRIWQYGAFEYLSGPKGFTGKLDVPLRDYPDPVPDGICIGLRSDVLDLALSAKRRPAAAFVGGHELKHLDQLVIRGEPEGKPFTWTLFRQEIEASAVGLSLISGCPAAFRDKKYQCRAYHYVLAMEATLPVVIHVIAAIVAVAAGWWAGWWAFRIARRFCKWMGAVCPKRGPLPSMLQAETGLCGIRRSC